MLHPGNDAAQMLIAGSFSNSRFPPITDSPEQAITFRVPSRSANNAGFRSKFSTNGSREKRHGQVDRRELLFDLIKRFIDRISHSRTNRRRGCELMALNSPCSYSAVLFDSLKSFQRVRFE